MPKRVMPTQFKAGRKVTVGGVAYNKGDVVPNTAVAATRRLGALVSRLWLIPDKHPKDGTAPDLSIFMPIHYSPAERKKIAAT